MVWGARGRAIVKGRRARRRAKDITWYERTDLQLGSDAGPGRASALGGHQCCPYCTAVHGPSMPPVGPTPRKSAHGLASAYSLTVIRDIHTSSSVSLSTRLYKSLRDCHCRTKYVQLLDKPTARVLGVGKGINFGPTDRNAGTAALNRRAVLCR